MHEHHHHFPATEIPFDSFILSILSLLLGGNCELWMRNGAYCISGYCMWCWYIWEPYKSEHGVLSFCSVSMIRISRIYWEYLCRDCRTVVDERLNIGYRIWDIYMQKERELLLHSSVTFFDANPSIASIRCSLDHRAYLETMAFTKCAVLKHNEGTRWSRKMGKGNISVISWHRQAGNCRSNSKTALAIALASSSSSVSSSSSSSIANKQIGQKHRQQQTG